MAKLQPVDPMVLNLFPNSELRNFTLTGRLKHLLKYWEVLPSNPEIPEWVSALNTNFNLGQAQKKLAQQEEKCQFQNQIWQVGKWRLYWRCRISENSFRKRNSLYTRSMKTKDPWRNEKTWICLYPTNISKMEAFHLVKYLLKGKDYMCQIDLEDAYFCVPLLLIHRVNFSIKVSCVSSFTYFWFVTG